MSVETGVETICAISTPQGEGGIGIIRISGSKAHNILKSLFRPKRDKGGVYSHRLYLGYIVDPSNKKEIDEVFAVFMDAPNTYTREDVAEIHCHGGLAVQQHILSCILRCGARLAEPGEFTKRAFLNGRIDLLQAESVLDIIQSETKTELESAMSHLKGVLSRRIDNLRENIKNALVEIETQIDFSDEDITIDQNKIISRLKEAKRGLDLIIESYYEGRAIKSGFEVLILGRTNVGKSSLLNALLLEEKAIVTPIPGTTRDIIEGTIHIKGIKIKLIDTAGLRRPKNLVEDMGIERAKNKIEDADVILWVLDGSEEYKKEDDEVYNVIKGKNIIAIINKIDLPQMFNKGLVIEKGIKPVSISALKNIGIEDIKKQIYKNLMGRVRRRTFVITNLRHRDALARARDSVKRGLKNLIDSEPLEFAAFELNDALYNLGLITGETCPEEILNTIFERFCIGK